MEAYLTPERESLLRLLEVAGIEIVENKAVCAERNHEFADLHIHILLKLLSAHNLFRSIDTEVSWKSIGQ